MAEGITPENYGPWSIHKGEHCGVRIDGPNGRSVLHVTQRDAHPTHGQGISQSEAQVIAEKVVALWNAAIPTGVSASRHLAQGSQAQGAPTVNAAGTPATPERDDKTAPAPARNVEPNEQGDPA